MSTNTSRFLAVSLLLSVSMASSVNAETETYRNGHLIVSAQDLASTPATAFRVIVDVRTVEEFRNGHIPGALQLDPNAVVEKEAPIDGDLRSISEISDLLGNLGIDTSKEVILYDDRGGFHASRMFWLLEYLGHQKVRLLNGGLSAWVDAGNSLQTGKARAATPRRFVPALAPRRFASADWILERQYDVHVEVLDVRPKPHFDKGHIPWATNLPWKHNLNEEGFFRSAQELRAHFETAGVSWQDRVVIHCQTGLASSHSYVALRLVGHPNVRTYHRSWSEWGTDNTLPKISESAG